MAQETNDLVLNLAVNKDMSLSDYQLIGFNSDNTSIKDIDSYRDNKIIKDKFTNEAGNFDEAGFRKLYNTAILYSNAMDSKEYRTKDLTALSLSYDEKNALAPMNQRKFTPDFTRIIVSNPDLITTGLGGLDYTSDPLLSQEEIAQGNLVLLNPVAYDKGAAPKWGKNPHDGFFDYFTDTLVLATYNEEGDHRDPVTGEMVHHKKGDRKLNDEGSYYYEVLDGRSIYDKVVLNKMNVLTTEGNWANDLDFFDSDDMKKSAGGAVMKELALVGTMFIPYIGPWVRGLSVATQSAGLLATLAKMATFDSDNPTLSAIEGWSKSVSRSSNVSQYAQLNVWCLENWIHMIGDVAGLLAEQRFIFEKVPAVFKGELMYGKNAKSTKLLLDAKLQKYLDEELLIANTRGEALIKNATGKDLGNAIKAQAELKASATMKAQMDLNSFIKDYNKIGEILSKGYMTAVTVGDTYGEAINAGASDIDATLLTLGYAIGEYKILSTGIGEWIMPEKRAENTATTQALKTLFKDSVEKTAGKEATAITSKVGKMQRVKDMLKKGEEIAYTIYDRNKKNISKIAKQSLVHGLGEGVEEVSEEVLADFSKGCYDVFNWLRGNDVRLNSFGFSWEDGKRSWNFQDIRDRYGMSFVGGLVGGGLTSAGTSFYNGTPEIKTTRQAMEQLVYRLREDGNFDKVRKLIEKTPLGDKNLSTQMYTDEDGMRTFKKGTAEDNQDRAAKMMANRLLDTIEDVINAHGSSLRDGSFLDTQTLNDLRFNLFQNTVTASRAILRYNSLNTELVVTQLNINLLLEKAKDLNKDGNVNDYEARKARLSETEKKTLQEYENHLKETLQELLDLVEGKYSLDFIAQSLLELSPDVYTGFAPQLSFQLYVKNKYHKKFEELNEHLQLQSLKEWEEYKKYVLKDLIPIMTSVFMDALKQLQPILKKQIETHEKSEELALNFTDIITSSFTLESNPTDTLATMYNIGHELGIKEFDTLIEEFNEKLKKIDNTQNRDDYESLVVELRKQYLNDAYTILSTNALKILEPFIKLGYVTTPVKLNLMPILNTIAEKLKSNWYGSKKPIYDDFDEIIGFEQDENNPNEKIYNQFVEQLDKFNNLQATPAEIFLNQFLEAMGMEPSNIIELISRLKELLSKGATLEEFTMDSKMSNDLMNALQALRMYRTVVAASKNNDAGLTDRFGFVTTLNEVSEKLSKEKKIGKPLNFVTFSADFANALQHDLFNLENTLKWYKDIYDINRGNKLAQLDKVSAKACEVIMDKLKLIIQVGDDDPIKQWDGWGELAIALNMDNFPTLKMITNQEQYTLNKDQKKALEQESMKIGDAVYNFFSKNQSKLNDPAKLSELISLKRFPGLISSETSLLNEKIEELDDKTFVWWLAGKAAIKTSDFYHNFKEILDPETGLMSVVPQEIAIFNNVASIVNGNVFSKFQNAWRYSLQSTWENMSQDERIKFLKDNYNLNELTIKLFVNKNSIFSIAAAPRYDHITFTEGIAGAGKTNGVTVLTVKYLLKYYTDNTTKNMYVISCSDEEGITTQGDALNEKLNKIGHVSTIDKFLKQYYPEYIPENNGSVDSSLYTINETEEVVSNLKIKASSDTPTLLIVDEGLRLNSIQLDLLNKLAIEKGFTILMTGDFDQTQNTTILEKDGIRHFLKNFRQYFIHSPKLGLSLRTDNSIKTFNVTNFQYWMNSNNSTNQVQLNYYEDENGLFGDRVFNLDRDVPKDTIIPQIKRMIDTLQTLPNGKKEKIVLVCDDILTSAIANNDEIKNNPAIEIITSSQMQGREARYYIVEVNRNIEFGLSDEEDTRIKRMLYTGISRSLQGGLLLVNDSIAKKISNVKLNEKIDEQFKDLIRNHTIARKKILDEIVPLGQQIPFVPRTTMTIEPAKVKLNEPDPDFPTLLPAYIPTPRALTPNSNIKVATADDLKGKYGEVLDVYDVSVDFEGHLIPLELVPLTILVSPTGNNADATEQTTSNIVKLVDPDDEVPDNLYVLVKIGDYYQPFVLDEDNKFFPIFGIRPDGTYFIDRNNVNNPLLNAIADKLNLEIITKYTGDAPTVIDNSETYQGLASQLNRSIDVNASEEDVVNSCYSKLEEELTKLKDNPDYNPPIKPTSIEEQPAGSILHPEEEDTVILNDVVNQEEEEKRIIGSSINKLPLTTSVPIKDNDGNTVGIKINTRLYSFNMLELGAVTDDNGNIIDDGVYSKARIDSVNGLRKIDKIVLARPVVDIIREQAIRERALNTSKDMYLQRMSFLQLICLNTAEPEEILRKINLYLGFDAKNIRFAIHCSPNFTEKSRRDDSKEHLVSETSTDYLIFDLNKNEKNYHHNSKDERSDEIRPHRLVCIIGSEETGDILSIPLFCLNSPLTVLNEKGADGEFIYAEVKDVFDAEEENTGQINKAVKKVILEFDGNPKYLELIDQFKLFNFTFSGLFDISKIIPGWSPVKNMTNLGPMFSSIRGIYQYANGYSYDINLATREQWMDVSEFAKSPKCHVSSIFTTLDENYGPRGHKFVLVSYDNNIITDEQIVRQYEKQCNDPNEPPKVKLMNVELPTATVKEYIEHLDGLFDGKQPVHIGTSFTPFRLINILLQDEGFMNKYFTQVLFGGGKETTEKLRSLLEDVVKADKEQNYDEVNNLLHMHDKYDGRTDMALVTYLDNVLLNLAYGSLYADMFISGNNTRKLNNEVIAAMLEVLKKSNYSIQHNAVLMPQVDPRSHVGNFIRVVQGVDTDGETPLWTIDGKPIKIHGKLDNYVFLGDLSDVIHTIVTELIVPTTTKKGLSTLTSNGELQLRSKDSYNKPKTPLQLRQTKTQQKQLIKEKWNNVISKVNGLVDTSVFGRITNWKLFNQACSDICHILSETHNRLAFMVNGEIIFSEKPVGIKPKTIVGKNYSTELTPSLNKIIEFEYRDGSDNSTHKVKYDSVKKELIIEEETQEIQETPAVLDIPNFDEYKSNLIALKGNTTSKALENIFTRLSEVLDVNILMDRINEIRLTDKVKLKFNEFRQELEANPSLRNLVPVLDNLLNVIEKKNSVTMTCRISTKKIKML